MPSRMVFYEGIDHPSRKCDIGPEKSDEILYELYLQGDASAFEELYGRFYGRVLSVAIKRLGQRALAEEAAQQTFLRLHSWRHKYQKRFLVSQWIFVIAQSEINRIQKRSQTVAFAEEINSMTLLSQNDASPSNMDETLDFRAQLTQATESLTDDEAELLHMRFIDGLAFEEIAEELGLNAATLRQRVSRLTKRLKEKFGAKD